MRLFRAIVIFIGAQVAMLSLLAGVGGGANVGVFELGVIVAISLAAAIKLSARGG